jgi:ATP-dependent Clp protease protease subunit
MIHQPSGGAGGQATDMEIQVREILKMKRTLTEIYVKHNSAGRVYDEILSDMERDFYMTAQESVAYGLADRVLESR